MINIARAGNNQKEAWDDFVAKNYPPIGAFMASWAWGEFQKNLGRKVERYLAAANGKTVAVFTLVWCRLPGGFYYGYAPRTPVIDRLFFNTPEKLNDFFGLLSRWLKDNFSKLIFVRLEPPLELFAPTDNRFLAFPEYHVQPRRNLALNISEAQENIFKQFHSSTRSNIKKAERKGITAEVKKNMSAGDWDIFLKMAGETITRNIGKNIYPPRKYFEIITQVPGLLWRVFCGYHEGEPAAMNLVLFFGGTATYLFGASYTSKLPYKVTTYLHWYAMNECKKMGYAYYDLGGVDEKLWPSLTVFKRRFGGQEFEYMGNLDVPVRPWFYRLYDWINKIRKTV